MIVRPVVAWLGAAAATLFAVVPLAAHADGFRSPESAPTARQAMVPAPMAAPHAAEPSDGPVTWENQAVAENEKDGSSRGEFAFQVHDGKGLELDATNVATAHATCVDCRTVALAFQIGIFTAQDPVVRATNFSGALNENCVSCTTFAAAHQILLVTDQRLTITPDGRDRLRRLGRAVGLLSHSRATPAEMSQKMSDYRAEAVDILLNETRRAHVHGVLRQREMTDRNGRTHHHEAAPAAV